MSAFVRVKVEVGLATFRAIVATYGDDASALAESTDPEERATLEARLHLLRALDDHGHVGAWKARGYVVLAPEKARLLAEDLRSWGEAPGLAEFELATGRRNELVREAFVNIAKKLEAKL